MSTNRTRLRRWRQGLDRDERGTIPLLMLVMLVGAALAAALVPAVIGMATTTNSDTSRVIALNAAQAGVDVAVGQIRNAVTGTNGDPSKLPCAPSGSPLSGSVQTSSTSTTLSTYDVVLSYYVSDPVAHSDATPMLCVPGAGTFDTSSGKPTPSYVKITSTGNSSVSTGNGSTSGRTLVAVYALTVDNTNISGGVIRVYSGSADGSGLWCVDAGSATPAAGTQLKLQPCSTSTPTAPQQTFAYRADLTLQLVSSIGTTVGGVTYRYGLCVDIGTLNAAQTAPATNSAVVLKQCPSSTTWTQQWSFTTKRTYTAPLKNSASDGTLSTLCWTVPVTGNAHTANSSVTLGTCDGSIESPTDAWVPSPAVGAGSAVKASSQQWINFQQFGRCLNVTNGDVSAPYLTVPNCSQNPSQTAIPDQQQWVYNDSTNRMTVNISGVDYCLYSLYVGYTTPPSPDSILNHRALVTRCSSHPGVTTQQMYWKYSSPTLTPTYPYSQQYRFKDYNGNCLSIGTVTNVPGDSYGTQYDVWKKAVTESCDYSAGATRQMWNASNNVGTSSVQNIAEK